MNSEIVNIQEIHDVIIAYANGDFSKRLNLTAEQEERNVIVTGINMLGEELHSKTVSRDYFSSIFNSISDIVFVMDLNGNISDMNVIAKNSLSQKEGLWKGKNIQDALKNRLKFEFSELFKDNSHKLFQFENILLGENKEIPVSCSVSTIDNADGRIRSLLFIAQDITERILHEKNLLKATVSGQEKERKRLSYDLHDSLGQELNGIIMYMNVLERLDPNSDVFKDTLAETKKLVQTAVTSVRQISFNLMPSILLRETLTNCIKEMVQRINSTDREKIIMDLSLNGIKFNDPNDEVLIFRIIQEFMNNALKYSDATIIGIKICSDCSKDKGLIVDLFDNGKGFEMDKIISKNGLSSLRTRLDALNAVYSFESILDKGTKLNIKINEKTYQNFTC